MVINSAIFILFTRYLSLPCAILLCFSHTLHAQTIPPQYAIGCRGELIEIDYFATPRPSSPAVNYYPTTESRFTAETSMRAAHQIENHLRDRQSIKGFAFSPECSGDLYWWTSNEVYYSGSDPDLLNVLRETRQAIRSRISPTEYSSVTIQATDHEPYYTIIVMSTNRAWSSHGSSIPTGARLNLQSTILKLLRERVRVQSIVTRPPGDPNYAYTLITYHEDQRRHHIYHLGHKTRNNAPNYRRSKLTDASYLHGGAVNYNFAPRIVRGKSLYVTRGAECVVSNYHVRRIRNRACPALLQTIGWRRTDQFDTTCGPQGSYGCMQFTTPVGIMATAHTPITSNGDGIPALMGSRQVELLLCSEAERAALPPNNWEPRYVLEANIKVQKRLSASRYRTVTSETINGCYFKFDVDQEASYKVSATLKRSGMVPSRTNAIHTSLFKISDSRFAKNYSFTVEVKDFWVAVIGDSFTSGEGAPSYIAKDLRSSSAGWLYNNEGDRESCHTSLASYPFLLAQNIAVRKRLFGAQQMGVSVSHFGCSGAVISNDGSVTKGNYNQINALDDATDDMGRMPDLLVLSIGINNAGFAKLIEKCFKYKCDDSVQLTPHVLAIEDLPNLYSKLARRLVDIGVPPERVLLVPYPNIFFARDGRSYATCNKDHLPAVSDEPQGLFKATGLVAGAFSLMTGPIDPFSLALGYSFFEDPQGWNASCPASKLPGGYSATSTFASDTSPNEWKAVDRLVGNQLHSVVRAQPERFGWMYLPTVRPVLDRNGVCVKPDNWVQRICQSVRAQGDSDGAFHPNQLGHLAIGREAGRSYMRDHFRVPDWLPR